MWQRLVMSASSLKERETQVERTRRRTVSSEYNESCKQEALRMTIGLVRDLIHRVNQRLLLRNMYDTQQISRLLLREKNERVSMSKTDGLFPPGYFACPIQRETTFKVHFRLKAVVALNAVTRSVLLAFLLRYVDMKSESKLLDREYFMTKTGEETANTTKYMFFYRDRKSQVMVNVNIERLCCFMFLNDRFQCMENCASLLCYSIALTRKLCAQSRERKGGKKIFRNR